MPDLNLESAYPNLIVAGCDEVGRGPLAGPIVAGIVIIDQNKIIPGIKDSKKLSRLQRERLYKQIVANYIWAVAIIEVEEIDRINILEANRKLFTMAVDNLQMPPDIVLIDGNMKFPDYRSYVSVKGGDNLSLSIAAASIVAKVTRDNIMTKLDQEFPQYYWRNNSGYGTRKHIEAIRNYGYSIHHRKSFKIKSKIW